MRWRRQPILVPILASLVLLAVPPAEAGQICTVSATNMAFGNYDPFAGTDLDSTSTISVTCTRIGNRRVRYEIQLNTGQSGTYNDRAMTNGVSQLDYNLFRNRARTRIWGDGTSGTVVRRRRYNLPAVGDTRTRNETVRGRVFGGQNVTVGSYLDTITVTVIF